MSPFEADVPLPAVWATVHGQPFSPAPPVHWVLSPNPSVPTGWPPTFDQSKLAVLAHRFPSISKPPRTVAFGTCGWVQSATGSALGLIVASGARRGVVDGVVDPARVLGAFGAAVWDGPIGSVVVVAVVVVVEGAGGSPATVSDVAHGSPAEHVPPWGEAAVVSSAPPGTSAARATSKDAVAPPPHRARAASR